MTKHLADVRTAIYRFYDRNGRLLYVGITHDIAVRWAEHARFKSWWLDVEWLDVEWLANRELAFAREAAAVLSENPIYNGPPRGCGDWRKRKRERAVRAADETEKHQAKELIREGIASGEFIAGENLPPATALSTRFQIAQTLVASALDALYREGLIYRGHTRYRVAGSLPSQAPRTPRPASAASREAETHWEVWR